MKMKSFFYCLCFLSILLGSCKKENSTIKPPSILASDSLGFSAKVITSNSVNKNWRTTSSNSNQVAAVAGVDYFANRGGINPDELTLMSFGKFTDDSSSNIGRLTIFIKNVSDTGTYYINGSNPNNAVLSVSNGIGLENFTSGINHQGYVVVTKYDTIRNVISGTFVFQLASSGNIIQVENGAFTDVPFVQ